MEPGCNNGIGPVLVSPESQAIISKLLKEMRKDSGMNCKGIAETDLEDILFQNGFRQGTAEAVPKSGAKEGGFSR